MPDGAVPWAADGGAATARPVTGVPASVLYAVLAVAAVVAASVLRAFHDATPRLPGLGPFGSVLFPAIVLLSVVHLAHRRRGADRLDFPEPARGLALAGIVPLLIVLLAEKWVTTDLLVGAYDWIGAFIANPFLADATYRLWTALGLLGISLALLPLLRQVGPRLALYTTRARARVAARDVAAAALVTAALLALLRYGAGAGWSFRWGPLLAAAAAAQLARGVAEEFFYRGLLQTTLVRLLIQARLPDGRLPRLLGTATVSLGFALEHVDARLQPGAIAGLIVYVFVMSMLLGTLLEVSRNLYVTMAAHAAHNLVVVGAVPLPCGAEGQLLILPNVVGLVFFTALFSAVVIAHYRRNPAP